MLNKTITINQKFIKQLNLAYFTHYNYIIEQRVNKKGFKWQS